MEVDGAAGSAIASSSSVSAPQRSSGRYRLLAVVSHMGRSADHGHYVCHVRRGNQWILFNDDVVSGPRLVYVRFRFLLSYRDFFSCQVHICEHPPMTHGFMYLYGPEEEI